MKYYLIAGEASGDLHASRLMRALKRQDSAADFRFFGGDLMAAEGGTLVRHYRSLAYMGVVPVLLHLPTILSNMRFCKQDISAWHPDVVILVDYPGFNLDIAKFVKRHALCPVYYYISPKIWAWKEYRIKRIKRDVDELFSILPFEIPFFEQKHHYPIHYVGNPTADEVREWRLAHPSDGRSAAQPSGAKPVIALLAGSRQQEIRKNLPAMLTVASRHASDYRIVIAGAPGIDRSFYDRFIADSPAEIVYEQTYALLSQATAALVTSGTATLETALFGVPQVVCYNAQPARLVGFLRRKVLKVKYISLVNLIADREVVPELVADTFTTENISRELAAILHGPQRQAQQEGYRQVWQALGDQKAPDRAAAIMCDKLRKSI